MFCKHSVWISTNAFLGRTPDPRHSSCVTIVTLMTLVTLFLGHPYTISRIQRHLRHSDFVFLVISLFLFRAVVNCKRHFTISVTVVTMVTIFLAYPYPYPINIVTTVTIVT